MTSERQTFATYTHDLGVPDASESPVFPLYSDDLLAAAAVRLKRMLDADSEPETQAALKGLVYEKIRNWQGYWFQRIDFPEHGITTTSDHAMALIDEGGLNTLGRRLTSEEASILRPWPKWSYIKPVLPDLTGKSVLEVGSSNGFFSFRFVELGAREVTGVEIGKKYCESAQWSASVLGYNNVKFINTDLLLDLTIEPHDFVFLSEVFNHFPLPLFGLLRIVNLAREMVILDTGAIDSDAHGIKLHSGVDNRTGHLIYSSFTMTDRLILDFLSLIGVHHARVTRYKAPREQYHILYKIDTRGLREARTPQRYPEEVQRVLDLQFITSKTDSGL